MGRIQTERRGRQSMTYAALLVLSGIAFLAGNLFPFINGGFADSRGFTTSQLGFVSSLFVLSGAVVVSTAPLWVRRVDWRWTTGAAVIALALGLVACTRAGGFNEIAAATCLMGVGSGVAQSTVMTGLGDQESPEKAYGFSLAVQMAMQSALALLATNYLLPRLGFDALLLSMASFALVVGVSSLALPSNKRGPAEDAAAKARAAHGAPILPAILGLVAIALFMSGILSMWFFMERIGRDAGLSEQDIGMALALSGVATIAASGVVGVVGNKVSDLIGTIAGVLIAVLGIFALGSGKAALFTIGVSAISCGWGITQPYLWAMTARVDTTKALFSASPAALGFGGALGASLGGVLAERAGFGVMASAVIGLFGATVLIAWAAAALFARQRRPAPGSS